MKEYANPEKLKNVYDELGTLAATAEYFGVSKKLILNYMKRFDIPRNSRVKTFDTKAAHELLKSGATQKEVASKFGVTTGVLHARLKEAGFQTNYFHKGYIETWSGYRMIHMPEHPHADSKGYVREHRLVVEQHLGRILEPNEHVHHIDRNKQNNAIENLEVLSDVEHTKLHSRENRKKCDEALAAKMLETMTLASVAEHFGLSVSGLTKRLQRTGYYKPLAKGGKRIKEVNEDIV